MIAISPTDYAWFMQLSSQPNHQSINFWTPTPWNIKQLNKGDKFYFLLKQPIRKIAGYGLFEHYENLSVTDAWNKFGLSNGVIGREDFLKKVCKYAAKNSKKFADNPKNNNPTIGCIILRNSVFWDEVDYKYPEELGFEFPKEVVKFKYYKSDYNSNNTAQNAIDFSLIDLELSKKILTQQKQRIGQNQFRDKLMRLYSNMCAISGESCSEVLEAAHIQPYVNNESNHPQNGILLRADLHILFDYGLLTITPDYVVRISGKIRSPKYRELEGHKIQLPQDKANWPSMVSIKYHNSEVYHDENLSTKTTPV